MFHVVEAGRASLAGGFLMALNPDLGPGALCSGCTFHRDTMSPLTASVTRPASYRHNRTGWARKLARFRAFGSFL